MALGSTQPPTEMSTRSISRAVVTKSGNLKFLEPSGPLQACNETALPVLFCIHKDLLAYLLLHGAETLLRS